MDDGTEEELGRGEVTPLPPGHDALGRGQRTGHGNRMTCHR